MKVAVSCGYRIHINSIDMNGHNRRVCGGLGFCVEDPKIEIEVKYSTHDILSKECYSEIAELLTRFRRTHSINKKFEIKLKGDIMRHKGLGSTTIYKLCVLAAIYRLEGKKLTKRGANAYGIGHTSGIGINAFFHGGLVVDAGYILSKSFAKQLSGEGGGRSAPLIFRRKIPRRWSIFLAIPKNRTSINGAKEAEFYDSITPISNTSVHAIAYEILMGVLPSVLEQDFANFRQSLHRIIARGTKPFETELHAKVCEKLLCRLKSEYQFAAITSLGPTIYVITDSDVNVSKLQNEFTGFSFFKTRVSNHGHRVSTVDG